MKVGWLYTKLIATYFFAHHVCDDVNDWRVK